MVLIGMDIATTTGLTCFNGERLVHCEAFRSKGDSNGAVFHQFRTWLVSTIASLIHHEGTVDALAAERPLRTDMEITVPTKDGKGFERRNPVTAATFERLHGLYGMAEEICFARNIAFYPVHQATWRKAFTGNGRAKKEETLALAQRIDSKIKSKDAAESLGVCWWLKGQMNPLTRDMFAEAS